jgi:hypothetical protein
LNAGQVYYLKADGFSFSVSYTVNITKPTSTVVPMYDEAEEGMNEPESRIDPTVTSSTSVDEANNTEIAVAPYNTGSEEDIEAQAALEETTGVEYSAGPEDNAYVE